MDAREQAVERLARWVSGIFIAGNLGEKDHIVRDDEAESTQLGLAREVAHRILDDLGLVAIDPALVERLRVARTAAGDDAGGRRARICYGDLTDYGDEVEELAEAVLAQVAK
jgi:hypothetical protein